MPTPEWLAEQFEAAPGAFARGGVSDARVGERSRGCGPGKLDSARPDRCQRRREPARLAHDRRRACVPGHVANADIAPGGSLLDDARMPDPVITRADGDPESDAMLADSVGLALLVVLETSSRRSASPSCCTTCSA